jgi:hypothetical protein
VEVPNAGVVIADGWSKHVLATFDQRHFRAVTALDWEAVRAVSLTGRGQSPVAAAR